TVVPGTTAAYSGSDRQTALIYGATAGFLIQSGNWLFGLEGDGHGPHDAGSLTASWAKPPTALEPAGTVTNDPHARPPRAWAAPRWVGVGEALRRRRHRQRARPAARRGHLSGAGRQCRPERGQSALRHTHHRPDRHRRRRAPDDDRLDGGDRRATRGEPCQH